MGFFECCRGCQKRHAGCHSECKDYIDDKAQWERVREAKQRDDLARKPARTDYLNNPVWYYYKN